MSFDTDKQKTLKKMLSNDKSNKGSVDKPIQNLLDKINTLDDYYTTSSCSGRIILIKIPESGSKKDTNFLLRTHELANADELITLIHKLKELETVWLRQEPVILHVAARTLKDASKLLRLVRIIGFKRCGLFEVEKRFLMELVSTEKIDAIIAKDGEVLVSDKYIRVLVEEANKRLKRTWEKTKKLEKELSTIK
ncbi:MAG: hypothetical protein KKF89_02820 [Nanoarchaeota archaeon]|nr:hypothetical protein [Nanoarchaeota archaeon]MBU1854626.1 hypothetical protein [Nanoarchaeota archaeon]